MLEEYSGNITAKPQHEELSESVIRPTKTHYDEAETLNRPLIKYGRNIKLDLTPQSQFKYHIHTAETL